jgi:hypothetical protein
MAREESREKDQLSSKWVGRKKGRNDEFETNSNNEL